MEGLFLYLCFSSTPWPARLWKKSFERVQLVKNGPMAGGYEAVVFLKRVLIVLLALTTIIHTVWVSVRHKVLKDTFWNGFSSRTLSTLATKRLLSHRLTCGFSRQTFSEDWKQTEVLVELINMWKTFIRRPHNHDTELVVDTSLYADFLCALWIKVESFFWSIHYFFLTAFGSFMFFCHS